MFLVCAWFVGGQLPEITPTLFYVLLGLAAYRGGRAVAFNSVFQWLRELMGAKVVPDSSGAGDSEECRGRQGIRYAFCELVTCPICSGTWVGMLLLVARWIVPDLGNGLIVVLAAAGVAELLHWGSEFLSWKGRAAREQAGTEWERKHTQTNGIDEKMKF